MPAVVAAAPAAKLAASLREAQAETPSPPVTASSLARIPLRDALCWPSLDQRASSLARIPLRDALCWPSLDQRGCSGCNSLHLSHGSKPICSRHLALACRLRCRRQATCAGGCGKAHPSLPEIEEAIATAAAAAGVALHVHEHAFTDATGVQGSAAGRTYHLFPADVAGSDSGCGDATMPMLPTPPTPPPLRVAVDLGYDEVMSSAELKSLATQVTLCHALANLPEHRDFVSLTLIGLRADADGNTDAHDDADTNTSADAQARLPGALSSALALRRAGAQRWERVRVVAEVGEIVPPERLVYLSPDAVEPLSSLSVDKTYIIGGLVDRTPLKSASRARAEALGLECRRLPLLEHLPAEEVSSSAAAVLKALNVNAVMQILVTLAECGDWKEAILAGLSSAQRGFRTKQSPAAAGSPASRECGTSEHRR